jgi:hypothetical protein
MKRKESKSLARKRALAALSRMRTRHESLSKAARALHTTPRTVQKFVGRQLRQTPSGRYAPKSSDRLKREINVFGVEGYEPATVHSSKQARLASEHLIAINRFLRTGDTEPLKPFRGKRIGGIELLTDPDRIREFAEADLVKLDGLYRGSARPRIPQIAPHEFGRLAINAQTLHVVRKEGT